jgi:hypothetical protein
MMSWFWKVRTWLLFLGQINNEYRKLGQLMLDLLGRNMSVIVQMVLVKVKIEYNYLLQLHYLVINFYKEVLVKNYKVHQVVDIVSFQMKNE